MRLFISRVTLIIHISLCIDQICIVICLFLSGLKGDYRHKNVGKHKIRVVMT